MSTKTFGSFAVSDIEAARQFYGETLGLKTEWVMGEGGPIWLYDDGGTRTLVYPKPDYTPATFTVFNLQVDDIDGSVEELTSKGVTFERYEGFSMDEKNISRDEMATAAWLTDPAGNVVAVIQQ